MSGLPPRRRSHQVSSWADKSTLEILQLMGFPKIRSEKAIAATGSNGIQCASDWLLQHVNDPNIDTVCPREYIVYLCPKGELLQQLRQFWEDSLSQAGWNSAHNYFPHITLCSFFPMSDGQVDILDPLMELLVQEAAQWPHIGPLKLDLASKNKNFVGYFVKSPHDAYVENLMVRLQQEFLKAGVEMKPQKKQLHLTLAFQYNSEQHDLIYSLASKINPSASAHWEVQVYSRDQAVKAAEVRRVIKKYKACQADELELCLEDFVYMDPAEHANSPDGWFEGTSWRTGVSAFFPGNFTTKCAQMEVWTLHRYATLANFSSSQNLHNGEPSSPELAVVSPTRSLTEGPWVETNHQQEEAYDNVWGVAGQGATLTPEQVEAMYAKVNKATKVKKSPPAQRKFLIVRHGERCDFAFYKTWFDKSFDQEGRYTRINLNCPKTMVRRDDYKHFKQDAPLTLVGRHQANITGEALLDEGQSITYVYCSPALRCVETATAILKGLRSPCRLRVEPGLFEWCGWHKPSLPCFMTGAQLEANGFPVETEYPPFMRKEAIQATESVADYYNRSFALMSHLARTHTSEGSTILLVAHSGSLDALSRQMSGQPPRQQEQFVATVRGCPYCGVCCLRELPDPDERSRWRVEEPPILQLTHLGNREADWRRLLT